MALNTWFKPRHLLVLFLAIPIALMGTLACAAISLPHHSATPRVDSIQVQGLRCTIVGRVQSLHNGFSRGDIMGMVAPLYYSAEMVRALPDDGKRYETVHGELLVTPAPRAWHQVVCRRMLRALDAYLERHSVGCLFYSPADISWGPDILVQPDLFVVELEQARSMDWSQMKKLLLTIEVLSPSTARYDRYTKRRLYQEVGVPFYWIVDLDEKLVEVWTPEDQFPTVERERVMWRPEGVDEDFLLDLEDLFKPL